MNGTEDFEVRWLEPVKEDPPIALLIAGAVLALALVAYVPSLLGPPRPGPASWRGGGGGPCRHVALVVAHPDDEAMFFWPTLLQVKQAGVPLSVLCLSTGNADGLGDRRAEEMRRSCERLGVTGDGLVVLDVEGLQDGMREVWPEDLVAGHVRDFVRARGADVVLTFDDLGVSGHPNHVATSRGVRRAARDADRGGTSGSEGGVLFRLLMLETVGLWQKYLGPLHLLCLPLAAAVELEEAATCASSGSRSGSATPSRASANACGGRGGDGGGGGGAATSALWCCVCVNPSACLQALAAHWSQLVWYRFLSALFSRYAYVNTYVEYQHEGPGAAIAAASAADAGVAQDAAAEAATDLDASPSVAADGGAAAPATASAVRRRR